MHLKSAQRIICYCTAIAILGLSASTTAQLEQEWLERHFATMGFLVLEVDVAVDAAGNSYVTSSTGTLTSRDVMTIKYAPDGTELWTSIHEGGKGGERGIFIALDSVGDVVVVAGLAGNFGILKYDAEDGSEILAVTHDPGGIDHPKAATMDAAGNIYVTGKSWTSTQNDYYTVKFDRNGVVQWSARYNGKGAFLFEQDEARAIAVDANGDVFVTGGSNPPGRAAPDYYTIKYDGRNGAEIWSQRYAGAGANDDAFALVLDSAGDVYVTGGSFQSGWKYVTIKYRNADGAQLWLTIDSPQACNVATEMAFDRGGDLVVSGWSDPDCDESNFNQNITTIKYRANDGVRLWSTSFGSNSVGTFDVPYDLVIDSAGNIYVTGENTSQFILLQYDSSTGEIIDIDTFRSNSSALDAGKAMALDRSENIVIAGVGRNGNTEQRDILTMKYTGQGGAVYDLQVANLVGGSEALFSIAGATPNQKQFIAYSLRGLGSTQIPKLNITLDLAKPVLLTSGRANADGRFEATISIPRGAAGRTVWFQGAEMNNTTAAFREVVQ